LDGQSTFRGLEQGTKAQVTTYPIDSNTKTATSSPTTTYGFFPFINNSNKPSNSDTKDNKCTDSHTFIIIIIIIIIITIFIIILILHHFYFQIHNTNQQHQKQNNKQQQHS
jgi:heme/copper-type cytochrome/quinol oxidase subunit 2